MKANRMICLFVFAIVAIAMKADNVEVDGIIYSVDKAAKEASVVQGTDRDALVIADSIESEGVKYAVTSIKSNAFRRKKVKSIVVGHEVKTIKASGFADATSLESIVIPDNVTDIEGYAFYRCSALKEATIGKGVAAIGNSAFQDCSSLETLELSDGLVSIGYYAFSGCGNLREIRIPSSVAEIKKDAFSGCEKLAKADFGSLESLCNMKFDDISSNPLFLTKRLFVDGDEMTEVVIPEGVTSLNTTFANCSGITSVTLPTTLKEIGIFAFYQCSGVKSVVIPEGVASIGEAAFEGCASLEEIIIPSSVQTIGKDCFRDVNAEKVSFATVESLCGIQFENQYSNPVSNGARLFINGDELLDLEIPDGVTAIRPYVFENCSQLKSVKIPNSVKEIGVSAFEGCTGLERADFASVASLCSIKYESLPLRYAHNLYIAGRETKDVYIPEGVSSIVSCAFSGSNIESITMSDDVAEINVMAIEDCPNLESIKFGKGIKRIAQNFAGCPNFKNADFADLDGFLRIQYPVDETYDVYDHRLFSGNPLYFTHRLYVNGEEIKEITFPSDLKKINDFALHNCESVESIVIPEGVECIGKGAFYGCKNLVSVNLPSTLEACTGDCFLNCKSLESITVAPNTHGWFTSDNHDLLMHHVNSDVYVVVRCQGNTIPDGVTAIGASAFYGRGKLTSVYIPSSVTRFDKFCFGECDSINDFYYEAVNMPSMQTDIFRNTPTNTATLHVPEAMIESFRQTAPWSGFGQIVALKPDDMPDGVEQVSAAEPLGPLYDLQGRRLTKQPERGMYIENGRVKMR